MFLVSADEMKEFDRITIEDIGISGLILMEFAGRGCAEEIMRRVKNQEKNPVAIFCGAGNNAGDGFVVARHLYNNGYNSTIFLLADPLKLKGDALTNFNILKKFPITINKISNEESLEAKREDLNKYRVFVDALFGTGLNSPIKGIYKKIIEVLNELDGFKVAIDIPSGIDASNGKILGCAFKADLTTTFGLAKTGLYVFPGAFYAGEIKVIDIGIPKFIVENKGLKTILITEREVSKLFKRRIPDSHKGNYGHLLCICGSKGKAGAALLCGIGALRAGVGLCTIATEKDAQAHIEGRIPELMIEGVMEEENNEFIIKWDFLNEIIKGKDAICAGSGLSTKKGIFELINFLIKNVHVPLILDADAINVLEGKKDILKEKKEQIVLTPHPGEMARFLGIKTSEVQANRISITKQVSKEFGVFVILKGARTIVASPDGRVSINPTGNPGMATAGSGDILTGIVGSLAAGGIPLFEACYAGAFIHGLSGDMAKEEKGETSLITSDLLPFISEIIKKYESTD